MQVCTTLLTETTSNLYLEKGINSIDQLIFSLTEDEFQELQPEVLITFGGMIVSKKVKQFLRKYQPEHHWHIDEQKSINTFFCLSEFIKIKPIDFFKKFNFKITQIKSNYQNSWLDCRDEKRLKHQQYLEKTTHSDFKVFEQVLLSIPNGCQLQISNSSIIRYAQLFQLNKTLNVFCNRGTSGIDGSTSTAIGAAFAAKNQTVFITGDLSFFYDSNALWNNYIPNNFRIIIVNNAGGGIFRFIPGPKTTNALDYFETPHNLTAKQLCEMHNFEYQFAAKTSEVSSCLETFYQEGNQPKILEIFTDKNVNETVLKEYFNFLK